MNASVARVAFLLRRHSSSVVMIIPLMHLGCSGHRGGVDIWTAVRNNDVAAIERYLEAGGNVDLRSWNGTTPLFHAFQEHAFESYMTLLERGADPNVVTDKGWALVIFAASREDSRWLEQALDHGGNPDMFVEGATLSRRGPPLHAAIGSHSDQNARLLIDRGANINYVREDWPGQATALIRATSTNDFELVLTLLQRGADWKVNVGGYSFLSVLRTRDLVTFRLEEDRKALKAVHQWLQDNGIAVEDE